MGARAAKTGRRAQAFSGDEVQADFTQRAVLRVMSELRLPRRLSAPAPGWTATADVLVIGSGIAGLTTALRLAGAPLGDGSSARVLVVTKDVLAAGSTQWAQGGIAAALGSDDSPAEHLWDTLVAGVGACDVQAVQILVEEGPAAVRELVELGTRFDRTSGGQLSLTREGGHHRDRIAHAGGDATGAEIQRALVDQVLRHPEIEVIEHALVLDLLPGVTEPSRRGAPLTSISGATLHVMGVGQRDGIGAVRARMIVVATGGIGQVYASTTNPAVSTGDGVAAAMRAGATVRDLEFVQFHPTVLYLGRRAHGQQPLVSEAVRGEGAYLVDDAGVRFMQGEHELADLAPRDVVAKAIVRRMRETGAEHVWLDARQFGLEKWRVRFPTILATLNSFGIDPVRELIPVVPACHYASGGVRTDLYGRSDVSRLYVCGEAACTGVHGANRLASNSLLEGLVFGRRIAADIRTRLSADTGPLPEVLDEAVMSGLMHEEVRDELQPLMSETAGVLRNAQGLAVGQAELAELVAMSEATADAGVDPALDATLDPALDTTLDPAVNATVDSALDPAPHEHSERPVPGIGSWESTNLVTVAGALINAAIAREETRGSHWREDFPDRVNARFAGHFDTVLDADGALRTTYVPTAGPPNDGPQSPYRVQVESTVTAQ